VKIERIRPMMWRITLHAQELAALIAAARWAAESGENAITSEAQQRLSKVLDSYDRASAAALRVSDTPGSQSSQLN
jgi:predicted DNA-binding transcriptional regulator YafY